MDDLENLSLEELKRLRDSLAEPKKDELETLSLDQLRKIHEAEVGKPTSKPLPKDSPGYADTFRNIRERIQTGGNDPLVGMAQNAIHQIPGVPEEVVKGVDALVKGREQNYEKTLAPKGDTLFERADLARLVGNTSSALLTGNPESLWGSIGNGMADSFMQPATSDGSYLESKVKDLIMGGGFGGALHGVGSTIGRILSPKMASDLDLKSLLDAGVKPSLGQATGDSWLNRMEERVTGLPWLGDALRDLRRRGQETWNTATINKAIEPTGATVSGPGIPGITQAQDAVSKLYDDAIGGVGDIPFDRQSWLDFNKWAKNVERIKDDRVRYAVIDPIQHNVDTYGLNGGTYKKLDSNLDEKIAKYRYGNGADGTLDVAADHIQQYSDLLRNQIDRAFPQRAGMLNDADLAYAGYKRVENAAKKARNNGSVFTPAQLKDAIYAADKSSARLARGDSMLQRWADIGDTYIRDKVPDSGTPARALAMMVDPVDSAGLALAANTNVGGLTDAILSLTTKRPEWMKRLGNNEQLKRLLDEMAGGMSQEYSPWGR